MVRWLGFQLERERQLATLLNRSGAQRLDLETGDDVAECLSRFFESRRRRLA